MYNFCTFLFLVWFFALFSEDKLISRFSILVYFYISLVFFGQETKKKKTFSISQALFQNENGTAVKYTDRSRFPFSIFKCSKSFNRRLKFEQHK